MKPLLGLTFAGMLATAVLSPTSAQTDDTMVIEFAKPLGPPATDRVVVFVDELACAEVRFDGVGPPTVVLGTTDQPAACRVEGASVTFLQFRFAYATESSPIAPVELSDRTTFTRGTTFEFLNWAPAPPIDPGPPDGPLPDYMRTFVQSGATLDPIPGTPAATGLEMFLDFTSVSELPAPLPLRVVVFVNEIACTRVAFGEVSPPIVLLGGTVQPKSCGPGAEGTEISFLIESASGIPAEMFERTTYVNFGYYTLTNWAPQPPGTPLPAYMQAYLDGDEIAPAPAGNAGLEDTDSAPAATLLVLGTLALLLAARRLTAARPR